MNGSKTDPRLKDAARAIAETIPGAQHGELAGQTHNVKPAVLTPAVVEFLTRRRPRRRGADRDPVHHHAQDQRALGGGRHPERGADCACGSAARRAGERRGAARRRGPPRRARKACGSGFPAARRTVDQRTRSMAATSCPPASASCARRRSTRPSSGRRARPRSLGDAEIDIRPVTEPWDIGMAPKPAGVTTRRYMVLRKATPATEAGGRRRRAQRAAAVAADRGDDAHAACTSSPRPCAPAGEAGATRTPRDGISVFDGPFIGDEGADRRLHHRVGGVARRRRSMGGAVHRCRRRRGGGREGAGVAAPDAS